MALAEQAELAAVFMGRVAAEDLAEVGALDLAKMDNFMAEAEALAVCK
jgi:hypothetical protein